MELVLGAGGVKGYGHVGVLRSIEKHKVAIGYLTGVSIGSLIAAFYVNGYSANDIETILAEEDFLKEGALTLRRWRKAMTAQALFSAGFTNLLPIVQKLVRKYELRPDPRLKTVAFDLRSLSPVVSSGNKFELPRMLASSMAVPIVMQPLVEKLKGTGSGLLVDGALFHTHPSHFCKGPAIVSKLGFATRLPLETLPPEEMLLHFAEMANFMVLDWLFDDPAKKHILIESGMKEVATLSFSSSQKTCKKMVDYGEQMADRALKKAMAAGRLPLVH